MYFPVNGALGILKSYRLDGTKIIRDCITYTDGAPFDEIFYYYDTKGAVVGFRYNGTNYYYGKNLQGDIIGIYDANGTELVRYEYSAYGEVLSILGTQATTLGVINLFRYRGYYYDTESGLYYLNSRYYDPVVGRFLNADILIGANGDITGYNMFAYCSDNPVVKVDSDGFFAITLTAFATFVVTAITGVCVIKVVSSPGFQKGRNKLYTTIGKTIYNGLHSLGTIIDNSIVAKKAKNAQAARDILDKVGIVYNSSHNLVSIKTGLHRRLHTTEYYALANSVIIIAYNAAGNSRVKQRSNVLCALYTIRTFILQMNEIAPF